MQVNTVSLCPSFICLGDRMPELSELYRDIVPKYAAKWRDLGVELKIPVHQLDCIAVNHTNHPQYSEQCCKAVLLKWMETTPNPTWTVLQKAIDGLSGLSYEESSESKRVVMISYLILCVVQFVCVFYIFP